MLSEIKRVLKAKSGKSFYKSPLGKVFFCNEEEMSKEIKPGKFVYYRSSYQTKRKPAPGETAGADGFIALEGPDRKVVNIVEGVFDTIALAVSAVLNEQDGNRQVVEAMKATNPTFTLEEWKEMEAAI